MSNYVNIREMSCVGKLDQNESSASNQLHLVKSFDRIDHVISKIYSEAINDVNIMGLSTLMTS